MPKSLLFILCVAVTLMGLVFLFGLRQGPKIDTSFVARLDFSAEYIFNFITDIEKYPARKNDLENLEILQKEGQTVTKWRENYKNGLWREYEIIKKIPYTTFEIKLIESSNNHRATITYNLNEGDQFTEISMTEVGEISDTFRRGLRFVSRDSSFLEDEVKWIRVAIHDELITRP